MSTPGPRVLVLAWADLHDKSALSGMPFGMRRGLEEAGCDVVLGDIGPLNLGSRLQAGRKSFRGSKVLRSGRDLHRFCLERLAGGRVRRRLEIHARACARLADQAVRRTCPDVVFGPCMSRPLGFMETSKPIVYASDATASLLVNAYDVYRRRGRSWKAAMHDFENQAIARADRVALASRSSVQSAIEDHQADPAKVSVVPLGANVSLPSGEEVVVPAEPPRPESLDLLLVAADPERKQLRLCVEIAAGLRLRGWTATLHYIGPHRPECESEFVAWAGRLQLGNQEDAAKHRFLLEKCHIALLPSLAEMYGISPIESAAYARPAVVSDVGGLSTVILDRLTGRVLPATMPCDGWVDAIEGMVEREDRYRSFSSEAFKRYESVLNWPSWGASVRTLMEELI